MQIWKSWPRCWKLQPPGKRRVKQLASIGGRVKRVLGGSSVSVRGAGRRSLVRLPTSKMDRAIIQALQGLVPTISGPLPPELVNLATSLLAQSRNKASNLKAEEEIARTYACANLACERLV